MAYPPNPPNPTPPLYQATAQFRPCPSLRGELTSALLKRPGLHWRSTRKKDGWKTTTFAFREGNLFQGALLLNFR